MQNPVFGNDYTQTERTGIRAGNRTQSWYVSQSGHGAESALLPPL
jgi:hypothetical protein